MTNRRRLAERYRRLIRDHHLVKWGEVGIQNVQRVHKNDWLRLMVWVPRLITIREHDGRPTYADVVDDYDAWIDLAVEYVRTVLPEKIAEITGHEEGCMAFCGDGDQTIRGVKILVRLLETAAA